MAENKCPQCGAPLDPQATECKFCGEKLAVQQAAQQFQQQSQQYQQQAQPQVVIQQVAPQPVYYSAINPAWPVNRHGHLVSSVLLDRNSCHYRFHRRTHLFVFQ